MNTMKMTYQDYSNYLKDTYDRIVYITGIENEERASIATINELFATSKFPDVTIFLCKEELNSVISECSIAQQGNYLIINDYSGTEFAVNILSKISEIQSQPYKIVLNTTGITKEALIILLFAIRNILINAEIELVYITPNEYGEYVIKDYYEPNCIPLAQGIHQIGLPSLLMLLSGYEQDGEFGLIRYYQPAVLVAGFADPPTEGDFKNRNEINHKEIVQVFAGYEGIAIREMIFSGNDPEQCCDDIINYLDKNGFSPNKYNISIAPMNNKLTTIGAFLVHEKLPQVQLVAVKRKEVVTSSLSTGKQSVYITKLSQKGELEKFYNYCTSIEGES